MSILTLFSWGYWGWGNATREFLDAVAAVEKSRGFDPPFFADIRIRRSGRAEGFVGDTFEREAGRPRHRHIAGLGNRNVVDGSSSGITIDRPEAVNELLEFAQEAERKKARVLYFCSCRFPHSPDEPTCHRTSVTSLLLKEAKRRGISVKVVEWPGGEPAHLQLRVEPGELRSVKAGRKSLAFKERLSLAKAASVAYGSTLDLVSGGATLTVGTGPAIFTGGEWCLPIYALEGTQPSRWSSHFRREHGLNTHENVATHTDKSALSDLCVYSIAQGAMLARSADAGGSGTLTERRAWTTGQRHLRAAQRENLELALLLGDATDCSRILYRAAIQDITIEGDETRITYSDLRALKGRRTPQDLVLASTGRNIASNFIRPYAICRTPQWLKNA